MVAEVPALPGSDALRLLTSVQFATAIEPLLRGLGTGDLGAASRRLDGLIDYLRGLIDRRRATPGDDLLTALVQVQDGSDRLSTDELIAMIFLLGRPGAGAGPRVPAAAAIGRANQKDLERLTSVLEGRS